MKKETSPFKFLDAYSREDEDIWFGREKETAALYDALSGVKHLLVYGPSGAGKTSLIECGLRNQFSDADWFALTIRRGHNMIASTYAAINEALENPISVGDDSLPLDPKMTLGHAVEQLYTERFQPVYLLFDQFEELLILGSEASRQKKDEREVFFESLNELIRFRVPCRVILIMREEFIGHLSEYEHLCPSIFQHRFRLEKMRKDSVSQVIHNTLTATRYEHIFTVEHAPKLASAILAKLPDNKQEIELAHVQVFLEELWDRANQKNDVGQLPVLSQELITENDNLERILDSFLKKQLSDLETSYGKKVPLELLATMISERHTKLQLSASEIEQSLQDNHVKINSSLLPLLKSLEASRVLRTLKSGEKTKYEISHDLLALVVGQNLTEEMKMRDRAGEVYRVYESKKGYFTKEDLDYIRPFQEYKIIPPYLQQRIEESEQHWTLEDKRELEATKAIAANEAKLRKEAEEERQIAVKAKEDAEDQRNRAIENEKRAIWWTRLAIGISIAAILLALFALFQFFRAQDATKKAEELASFFEREKNEKEGLLDSLEVQYGISLQRKTEAEEAREEAEKAKTEALLQEKTALKNLALAQKSRREIRKQKDTISGLLNQANEATARSLEQADIAKKETAKTQQALNNLQVANANIVDQLLDEVEKDFLNLRYEEAQEKLQSAATLKAEQKRVFDGFLELAFWHNESGNPGKAYQLLNFADSLINKEVEAIYPFTSDTIPRKAIQFVMQTLAPGLFDTLYQQKYYPKMMKVPGGSLAIEGATTNYEILLKDFWLAQTETTIWQFALFCRATGRDIDQYRIASWINSGNNPVVNVSWNDASAYCEWLSQQKEQGISSNTKPYRLPAEDEWYFAAKEGKALAPYSYSGSNVIDSVAWYADNSSGRTQSAASTLKSNALGFYDLSGNAMEWCSLSKAFDDLNTMVMESMLTRAQLERYRAGKRTPQSGEKALRGGSWKDLNHFCRIAVAGREATHFKDNRTGFRVARPD